MRELPVAAEADVAVVGGSVAGVAAAVAAARTGAQVFLCTDRTYLGEDLCSTLQLWLEPEESAEGELVGRLFGEQRRTTPLHVKKTLDAALLDAGVQFLLACYATEVLRDANGQVAGIVLANRAGRQAVSAKVVIDATSRGEVARLAGASCRPWTVTEVDCRRVVLAESSPDTPADCRQVPAGAWEGHDSLSYFEYRLRLPVSDGMPASLARVEQLARDSTYRPGQFRSSARVVCTPPDPLIGQLDPASWEGLEPARLGHFQPESLAHLYVAGPAADVPREVATSLLRPAAAERMGRLIGQAAAKEASNVTLAEPLRVAGAAVGAAAPGEVCEVLTGLRPVAETTRSVASPACALPVWGRYQVVVVGGGTSGACAAIGAARQGARVLVLEFQEGLGGTGTLGLIGRPYHGNGVGFSREVPFPSDEFTVEDKMEWFRREILKAGGEIWFGALGVGAVKEGNRVTGAVVATTAGRGVVLADVVIDSTGNADLAIAAGADYVFGGDENEVALQGCGLPVRGVDDHYANTDYLLIDEADLVDVWRCFVGALQALPDKAYDLGPLLQTRERRRVVGDHVLSYLDQLVGRTYPDSIVHSASDYDSHGYPSQPFFSLLPHDRKSRHANHPAPGGACFTPYRCLLPRGLDGILVTGLGISMERDASAMIRMQRDMHNQGYAAGVAAARAAANGLTPRHVDIRDLQRHLVEIGSLPPEVLSHTDSYPLPSQEISAAVEAYGVAQNPRSAGRPLAVILSHAETALPLLRTAHEGAEGPARLAYAQLLGSLGEPSVVPELAAALDAVEKWDRRILQGNMAEYAHLPTPIDTLILSLGRTGSAEAVPPLLRKLDTLDATVAFSHHRSLALALQQLADPAAAAPLARLLRKPGMSGHAMLALEPLYNREVDKRRRLPALRELALARALFRCGDDHGLGKQILQQYRRDLRGLLAQHAARVLQAATAGEGD